MRLSLPQAFAALEVEHPGGLASAASSGSLGGDLSCLSSLRQPCSGRAVRLAAASEGLVLDPVYTGKAMAGLAGCLGDGRFGSGERVVFLHSGGTPGLFANIDAFGGGE